MRVTTPPFKCRSGAGTVSMRAKLYGRPLPTKNTFHKPPKGRPVLKYFVDGVEVTRAAFVGCRG